MTKLAAVPILEKSYDHWLHPKDFISAATSSRDWRDFATTQNRYRRKVSADSAVASGGRQVEVALLAAQV
jgi:hypothetical protein